LGCRFAAAFWWPTHRNLFGAIAWSFGLHAHQVPASGAVPGTPHHGRAVRETFCPSGAKDDPSDTASLLDLLLRRERLRQLQPDTVETRLLHFLVEERRRTVDEKTRRSNRLTDCLKLYFPQIQHWFDDVTSPLVVALLERWPSLDQLQGAHPGTLRKFFADHNCRSAERMQERMDAIYAAVPATNDEAVQETGAMTARGLLALLTTLGSTTAFDRRIAKLVAAHPDGVVCVSARRRPCPGPALAGGLRNASRLADAVLRRDRPHQGG
jgi:hypothetical protein